MQPSYNDTFYLSGPMTGYPEYNYPEFERVTNVLREASIKVLSPHENPAPQDALDPEATWRYYMQLCRKQVEESTAILLMFGWPESRGACLELDWSITLGHPVFYLEQANPINIRIVRMSRIQS